MDVKGLGTTNKASDPAASRCAKTCRRVRRAVHSSVSGRGAPLDEVVFVVAGTPLPQGLLVVTTVGRRRR